MYNQYQLSMYKCSFLDVHDGLLQCLVLVGGDEERIYLGELHSSKLVSEYQVCHE